MADDFLGVSDLIADALDLSGTEINNILRGGPVVARLPFTESSNGTTHKYITHTADPVTGFRAENAGREFDHSVDVAVTATLKILDWSWASDKAVADAWKRGREAFLTRESMRHVKSAVSKMEKQLFYGTSALGDSTGFAGLANLAQLDDSDDSMVVNAAGTTADTASSVYLLNLGESSGIAGVYKGDGPAFDMGETIVQDFLDGDGKHYPAYYTPACTWFGMQIGGAYSVSRIANLTADAGKGLTDDLIYAAIEKHPVGHEPDVIVMNRRSREQLRSSRTATNATGTPAPLPEEVAGIPILLTDTLLNTEALLTAA